MMARHEEIVATISWFGFLLLAAGVVFGNNALCGAGLFLVGAGGILDAVFNIQVKKRRSIALFLELLLGFVIASVGLSAFAPLISEVLKRAFLCSIPTPTW